MTFIKQYINFFDMIMQWKEGNQIGLDTNIFSIYPGSNIRNEMVKLLIKNLLTVLNVDVDGRLGGSIQFLFTTY